MVDCFSRPICNRNFPVFFFGALYHCRNIKHVFVVENMKTKINWLGTLRVKYHTTAQKPIWNVFVGYWSRHKKTKFRSGTNKNWWLYEQIDELQFLVKSNQIWIVVTPFWLIWFEAEFCLVPYQSEKCNYKPNLI